MAGTPLYMSPEAIQTPVGVDARSDIYSIGALGYFLITGQPVFTASTLLELCHDHVNKIPQPPSERLGKPVSSELEAVLLACLEKSRDKRPQSARELAELLDRAPSAGSWSTHHADSWWVDHEHFSLAKTLSTSLGQTFSNNPKGSSPKTPANELVGAR